MEIRKGANISPCEKYRYALWRIWDEDKPMLLFIMLNPSTADASADDPTIRRCMRFAAGWGYGGIYVCNLFAFRSTSPEGLKTAEDPIGRLNDAIIKAYLKISYTVCFAWGTKGGFMNRDKAVADICTFPGAVCLEKTKDGHPKHPLYVKGDIRPQSFLLPLMLMP